MSKVLQELLLDCLLQGPRLFGPWNLKLGSTFLLIKDGYAHAIPTQNGRPENRHAKRITNEGFEVAPEGMPAAFLERSPLGLIVVAAPGAFMPSVLGPERVNLTEYNSSVLGELTWVEPTDSSEFGGYDFSGDPQDLRAA